MAYGGWPKYVSVAQRNMKARKKMAALKKKGKTVLPVEIEGRTIAHSFWGKAWCEHLEQFSDYENRLPRGRTYVRNGSVCHLDISEGRIDAIVSGSELYNIAIRVDPLPRKKWKDIQKQCAGSIGSMVELLQGKLSDSVMLSVTDRRTGLFPKPSEIHLKCDCPDWADLCKHLAAVLYGVGARLDDDPSLLFQLRGVDQRELVSDELSFDTGDTGSDVSGDLADIFGIEIDDSPVPEKATKPAKSARKKVRSKASANPVGKTPVTKTKAKSKSQLQTQSQTKPKAKTGSKAKPRVESIAKIEARAKALSKAMAELKLKQKAIEKAISEKTDAIADTESVYTAEMLGDFRTTHGLTPQDFAALIQKSAATVKNWESRTGTLKLQISSRNALDKVFTMNKKQVRQALDALGHAIA